VFSFFFVKSSNTFFQPNLWKVWQLLNAIYAITNTEQEKIWHI